MTRADLILIIATACLLPGLYLHYWGDRAAGGALRISVGGEEYAVVSLLEDQEISVPGRLGVSRIEIKAGRAHFIDSPCRGKQCIHSGWLHDGGEFAACLPNRVSVAVVGSERRFDSINF